MKNSKWLALLLVFVLVSALMPSALAADYVEPFTDVPVGQFYAEPVSWAVSHDPQITNGVSGTSFAPNKTCTRAEIVTFLYRAEGKPAVSDVKNPFTETVKGAWYETPMLWAVENEITNGVSSTTFAPDKTCTRAEIVTFLYRVAGKPAVSDVKNPFTDTVKGEWYEDAMLWAVQNEITNGKSATTFEPNTSCTRGEAVTFLYRYYHLAEPGYVLMNIPYADFFSAEGVQGVDAVSSSTVKTFNQNMSAGSYHDKLLATEDEVKNSSILGVTYPVYVPDLSVLDSAKEIKASDKATITVAAGKSATTTKEVEGVDLLFASGSYAWMKLDAEPNNFKTLSVGKDGKFAFSAVKNGAVKAEGMEASLTYGGHYTDIAFTVSAKELEGVTVNGIVITADGVDYALRHVEDIWRITSLGWNWNSLDGKGLSGKTITAVTYYIKDADGKYQVLRYDVNVSVKQNPGEGFSAEFVDANTIAVSGIPADAKNVKVTVKDQVGRGETATVFADAVAVQDGKVTLATPAVEGKTYVISAVSDNYADMSATASYTIPVYVLMNIPYADFYAAEGTSDVDAVTSATLNKTRTGNLAGGSYHKDPGGTDISGVVYPVYVADRTLLADLKEVTDADSVSITVTNRGTTTETTYTGKDALFENEDYAYFKLDAAPNAYKTLTKDRDGNFVFSAVNAEAKKVAMTTALTYGGHHTDITYKVTCDALPQSGITVSGVVITANGTQYALRHVYEIWRVIELGWNWDQLDENGLSGKTITNITYYITNAEGQYEVLTCDVNDTLKLKPAKITASFVDASTIALTGVPADAQNLKVTVRDQIGRGETATVFAENVAVQDGKIILTTPAVEGKNYVISFVSDNYADSSVTIPFGTVE